MGVFQRQSILNIIIAYIGVVVGAINTIILFPNIFSPDIVGLVSVLVNVSTIYALFGALGISNTAVRFFPFFRTQDGTHHGFVRLISIISITGFVGTTLLYLLLRPVIAGAYEEKSPLFIHYYNAMVVMSFFTLIFNVAEAYSRSIFKTVFPAFLRDVLLRFLITLAILLYSLHWLSEHEFVLTFIGIYSAIGLILLLALYRDAKDSLFSPIRLEGLYSLKEIIQYGLFSLVSGISDTLIRLVDVLMLAALMGLEEVGIYTRGFFLATMLHIPARGIYRMALPIVANYWKDKDMDGMKAFYRRISFNNIVIGLFIFVGIWISLDDLFTLMPPGYREGSSVYLVIGFGRIVTLLSGINYMILLTSHKFRFDTLFNVMLALTTIVLNYILIKQYGMIGAAFSTMIALVSVNLLRMLYLQYRFKIQPFSTKMIPIALLAVVLLIGGLHFPRLGDASIGWTLLNMVVKSLLFSFLYIGTIYVFKLSDKVTEFVDKFFSYFKRS